MDCLFQKNRIFIEIEIASPLSSPTAPLKKTIMALVDTGFTGELQLTYEDAFPLALTLKGTEIYNIADGSKFICLACLGMVSLEGRSVISAIDVKPAGDTLLGVNLLKKLGCRLKVDFVQEKASIELIRTHLSKS